MYRFQCKKEYHPKFSKMCNFEIFSKGLRNEFEIAMVNEPSVFEPLKFYCMSNFNRFYIESIVIDSTRLIKVIAK